MTTKTRGQIEALQVRLEKLPKGSPKKLWIRWKILIRQNTINRTIIACGALGTFAVVFLLRQVETLDKRDREATAAAVKIDVDRQDYDNKYRIYELERENRADCLASVISRDNFRDVLDTITTNVLLVLPEDDGARTFVDALQAVKEEKYQPIDPLSCGPEPTQPEIPKSLRELEVPVTTTLPIPITIVTTEN